MANFEPAVERLLKFEGGYVNDPDDEGGETKYGISKRAFPHIDIKSLTIEQAKEIYYRHYWKPLRADEILDQELANKLFDASVHMGRKQAVMYLQHIISTFKPILIDGIIGKETLEAINSFKHKDILRILFDYKRIEHYLNRVRERPINKKFLIGWLKRI